MRFIVFCLIALSTVHHLWAQAPLSPAPLIAPVDHPIRLSGTFGELRSNHFHGGIDIKSRKGTWGDPIYSIDDGYISRITVSPTGFGRALYIDHPSTGLTSVYGHLQSFSENVEAYVLNYQKDQQSFAIDLGLNQTTFVVAKGEQIARMGSTGYSLGPHLHFEIRKTGSGETINPQLYDFNISDTDKPIIKNLAIYKLDHELNEYYRELIPYRATNVPDTLAINAWRIGLGLETYDPHNSGKNRNGVYSLTASLDGDTIYRVCMDTISIRDKGYFDIHIDYQAQVEAKKKIHRCYKLPTDQLSIYRMHGRDGIIPLFEDRLQLLTLSVADAHGNEKGMQYYLKRAKEVQTPTHPVFQYKIIAGKEDTIRTPYLQLSWPRQALYQNLYFQYGSIPVATPGVYSAQYRLDRDRIPLHSPLELKIRPYPFPDSIRAKMTIVRIGADDKLQNTLAEWEADWLKCKIPRLGTYQVMVDTSAPTIRLERQSRTSTGFQFSFIIGDNLPPPGGLKYKFTLNDHWLLGEYDLKNDRLTCTIRRQEWADDKYNFKLLVEDSVGNTSTYDYRLNFK